MTTTIVTTWAGITEQAAAVAERQTGRGITGVYGIPRGGVVPAVLVAQALSVPLLDKPGPGCLVVDDLVDTGATLAPYIKTGHLVDALYRKPYSPPTTAPQAACVDGWLVFPWEANETGPEDAVRRLLQHIGENPTREGLVDTPRRVIKAWAEMTAGYAENPAVVLGTTFNEACDQLVAVTGIEFVSLCEHHVLPFTGHASIGYLPGDRVVGLSKLGRIVDTFARRLQVQERMTQQIADAIQEHLKPQGVAVVVRGQHSCMSCRGVQKRAEMVTSSMLGMFRYNESLRNEFLALERAQ